VIALPAVVVGGLNNGTAEGTASARAILRVRLAIE
jgi:hypothetical protein